MKFSPRPYQDIAIRHLFGNEKSALFARPGMGKTSSAAAVIDLDIRAGESHPYLVLAPKRVAKHTWPKEMRKWSDFHHLDVSPIVGTEAERLAALKRDVPIYTMNYEQIPWLLDHFGSRLPFRNLIPDESTKLKNVRVSVRQSSLGKVYLQHESGSSQRAAALARLAFDRKFRRIHLLTGTPAANGLKDLWGQMFFLDSGQRLGRSYGAFEERWFERVMKHRNDKFGELRLRAGAEEEINARVSDLCLALDPKDWFPDLKEPVRFTVRVELPAKARRLYTQMEREMYIELEGKPVEAFTVNSASMKCRQLAAGAVYTDPETEAWAEVHDVKIQALESIFEESGGTPLLVAYQFKSDLARLKAAFPKGVDLATEKGLDKFMKGEASYGFGHPASIGHGFDGLQDITNIIVFFSSDFNLEYRDQIIERIGPVRQLQSGHERKVLIYDIVAEDTVDEAVIERLETKCSVQEAFFTAMKRKALR